MLFMAHQCFRAFMNKRLGGGDAGGESKRLKKGFILLNLVTPSLYSFIVRHKVWWCEIKSLTVFCNPWEKAGKKIHILEFLHSFQLQWLITNVTSAKVVWTVSSYSSGIGIFQNGANGVATQISPLMKSRVDWIQLEVFLRSFS